MRAPAPAPTREQAILDAINEGVFTVDLDWHITEFNQAAERITGVRRAEALGRPCCDIFRANICEHGCALRQTLDSGKPCVNQTAHIIDRRGTRIPIRISTAMLRDEHGNLVGGVESFQDLRQVEQLRKAIRGCYTFEDIVGHSPAMVRLFELLPQVASTTATVLIEGPSGTGKELFARAIHHLSPRKNKPFVVVNCAALPDTLLESELFGHKAGAFTDARRDRPGRFALAHGGTIFLDEIGDVSAMMQMRLLRVLQERVIEPLGAVEPVPVDVRVIAATNRQLVDQVRKGDFRDDLYYRVRVIALRIPPLNERREDIPHLLEHIIARFNHLHGRTIEGVADDVLARLMDYDFPGNVRELENIIEHGFVLSRGPLIEVHHLPAEFRPAGPTHVATASTSLRSMEQIMIAEALRRHHGNRRKAALQLGIDPSTLYRKIEAMAIEVPESDGRTRRPPNDKSAG